MTTADSNDQEDEQTRLQDLIMDSVFSLVYAVCLIAVICIATRNFKQYPQMVNRSNVLIVVFLGLTLLSKSLREV